MCLCGWVVFLFGLIVSYCDYSCVYVCVCVFSDSNGDDSNGDDSNGDDSTYAYVMVGQKVGAGGSICAICVCRFGNRYLDICAFISQSYESNKYMIVTIDVCISYRHHHYIIMTIDCSCQKIQTDTDRCGWS